MASLFTLPVTWSAALQAQQKLPRRPIPGTDDSLPVIGLGNSNAFRQGDVPGSTALIKLFHEQGGAYVDCSGDSRFVVANVAGSLGIGNDLFLGTYFTGDDESQMRENIQRLLEVTGKDQLELKRCRRCNGIFMPYRAGQLFCCNGCGCSKPCSCGAVDRQRLLII